VLYGKNDKGTREIKEQEEANERYIRSDEMREDIDGAVKKAIKNDPESQESRTKEHATSAAKRIILEGPHPVNIAGKNVDERFRTEWQAVNRADMGRLNTKASAVRGQKDDKGNLVLEEDRKEEESLSSEVKDKAKLLISQLASHNLESCDDIGEVGSLSAPTTSSQQRDIRIR